MSNVLPSEAIAKEVFSLELTPQAVLLNELTDSVLQAQEGFKVLNLSADATQWIKSLTIIDSLTIIECLAHSLKSHLILDSEQQKLEDAADELREELYEFCPCGDLPAEQCDGEACGEFEAILIDEEAAIQDVLDPNWMYDALDEGLAA
ncbi:hypothetical protein [Pseudanabaena yagii]|uniref:Uncharacterized protein n=1 Tax=Pseudanabaena yagii GIHE-NHR1 TaxID=2722753 RepID=A0ABX1LVG4_9CYAN|nr:hypothetical protein [Pseudanabaena yagii]NMF60158.1 hypothetical protein [Pseudanabaena yagii GIHE-NHR1]